MERKNNYEIQAAQARALFCARDLDAVAREHGLRQEGQWLHLRLLPKRQKYSVLVYGTVCRYPALQ